MYYVCTYVRALGLISYTVCTYSTYCIYLYCIYVRTYVHLCMLQGEPVKGLHILATVHCSPQMSVNTCVCDDVFDVLSYCIVVVVCL